MKDITIKLDDISLHQLRDLMITADAVKVPLSEMADIRTIVSPREITRRNQSRTSYIYAMVKPGIALDRVVREAGSSLRSVAMPVDYKMEFTGEELKRKESMSNLSFALILSLVLVFMVLAAQFESLIQPFIIMLTIPLAAVGTILTFFVLGKSLNMMAYIGIIMLGGIAVNNAIILIDRINRLREAGMNKKEAIILAGTQRIRPILMTSLTTILALLSLTCRKGRTYFLFSAKQHFRNIYPGRQRIDQQRLFKLFHVIKKCFCSFIKIFNGAATFQNTTHFIGDIALITNFFQCVNKSLVI